MNDNSTIIELDADHQIWNNELNDMKEEISDMEAVVGTLDTTITNIKKEHFQNQFSIHRHAIDKIKNRIQRCQLNSYDNERNCFELVNKQKYNYHERIAILVDTQWELYNQLKEAFQLSIKA
ncbi:MAG: hypothetical protein ACJA1A_001695 [Saprospiraceae bacterium]|jgi:hypothetical protein|tara:strand:+ start:895 stop:1260 length:366 start_codon:yes stop_codon:yes gene_type:complete